MFIGGVPRRASREASISPPPMSVASAASREAFYSPPDDVVRIAKAYFATQAVANGGIAKRFELLFDSFANPAAAGARITGAAARQLLYRIGSVFVDMEMDNEFGSQRVALVGQILDSSNR